MKVINKTLHHNYEVLEEHEAGIVLTGGEVKSMQLGRVKLEAAYVKLRADGAYLVNAEIFRYPFDSSREYNPTKERKLLLHKKEIIRLQSKLQSRPNLTIAPVSCYNRGKLFKCKIALVAGKKDTQKRKDQKQREIKRKQEKAIKEYVKNRV